MYSIVQPDVVNVGGVDRYTMSIDRSWVLTDRMTNKTWADLIDPIDLEFLRLARVGRMATVGNGDFPNVVPICFALLDDPEPTVVSVLDEKPKQVPDSELARVRNILRHPRVGLTVDHYEEDWSKLVFIQIRGIARLVQADDLLHRSGLDALTSKYPQYRSMQLTHRPIIAITDLRIRVWRADPNQAIL